MEYISLKIKSLAGIKKFIVFLVLSLFFISCGEEPYRDLLPDVAVNFTIDLSLPAYIDLQAVGSWAYTPVSEGYGVQGVFIYNKGSKYIAFDRACPHLDVNTCSPMVFENSQLVCSCDDSVFNIFEGGYSADVSYFAREYKVTGYGNILQITNY